MNNRVSIYLFFFLILFNKTYAACICGEDNNPNIPINQAIIEMRDSKGSEHTLALELLKNEMEPNITNPCGAGLLLIAAINNDLVLVNELLSRNANPNIANFQGLTPIYSAAQWSNNEILLQLLEASGNPNTKLYECLKGEPYNTPLLTAAINNNIEGIKILLEYDADFTQLTDNNISIFTILINGGNDIATIVDLVDHIQQTSRTEKAKKELLFNIVGMSLNGKFLNQELKFLLQNGFDPNTAFVDSIEYNTPLMVSAFIGNIEGVKLLIQYGANIDYTNMLGYSLKRVIVENEISDLFYLLPELEIGE